jgi:Flp pilus assembly protein TadG
MRLLRGQRGQATIEIVGILPLLLLTAMFVWQLHLAASASNAAADAARTASRAQGLGGDARRAALAALPETQRDSAKIKLVQGGERVEITTDVPTIVPGLSTGLFKVHGAAELPGGS